jgi:hypothetical protein
MSNNLAYDPESGDIEVPYDPLCYPLPISVLDDFFNTLNAQFIILQHVSSLCDYKLWIDTQRGAKVIYYLCSMAQLNLMGEEFCARRMAEHKHATYFAIRREMDCEQDKEKQEERAQNHEKARRAKEAFARGGEQVLIKGK